MLKDDFAGRSGSDGELKVPDSVDPKKSSVVRKNFPEIWIYDVQKTSSGEITLTRNAPDSITDFLISGYAINKNKGFAVARTAKVSVFKNFFIKIEKPYSVQYGETANIQVIVHNYMDVDGDATVTLYNKKNQFTFVSGDTVSQSLTTFVKKQGTASVTFTIQPSETGKIILNVDGKLKGAKDEVRDFMLVDIVGISKFITDSAVIDLKDKSEITPTEMEFNIPDNIVKGTVRCNAQVSTTVLSIPDDENPIIDPSDKPDPPTDPEDPGKPKPPTDPEDHGKPKPPKITPDILK
jgi:uncharacterized protein YfaS (alpha-2-macroglobulin family)